MATYTLSRSSPSNTVITNPDGTIVYKISKPFTLGDSVTTITRGDELVATIQWNTLKKNTVTMNGVTRDVNEVFPKSKILTRSRSFTAPDGSGERFKWKYTTKLYCVSESTGLNIATYYRTYFSGLRNKPSTIDISPSATHFVDILIGKSSIRIRFVTFYSTTRSKTVTWAIMERESED